MHILLILPVLIPFLTAIVMLMRWGSPAFQRRLNVLGATLLLAASIGLIWAVWHSEPAILSVQIGNWPAPVGITLVSDLFSAIMVLVAGIIGFCVSIYSLTDMDPEREAKGYYPLLHLLLMGVCGSFLTGDIFNLYVWFEIMLISSFVLLALGGETQQLEGAVKYVTLNLLSSAVFLVAVGVTYRISGTLNMADVALQLRVPEHRGIATAAGMLFMIAFGIKAAVFPLFFWLPSSYHTPPVPVSAIFAGLLTKVGVYTLIRFFTLMFNDHSIDLEFARTVLLWVSGLTMLTGVLGAAAQNQFRRILSFHIVSQIGYMVMGLALYSPLAIAGSVFYIFHHIIVKTNLFLVSGMVRRLQGSFELKELGGLYRTHAFLALLFAVPALSLAGVPPLSGFWAKFLLIRASLEIGGPAMWAITATALLVSLLTLYSMTKIWTAVFWKPFPEGEKAQPETEPPLDAEGRMQYLLPMSVLAIITLAIGLCAHPFFIVALRAAEYLVNPDLYIQAILGGGG